MTTNPPYEQKIKSILKASNQQYQRDNFIQNNKLTETRKRAQAEFLKYQAKDVPSHPRRVIVVSQGAYYSRALKMYARKARSHCFPRRRNILSRARDAHPAIRNEAPSRSAAIIAAVQGEQAR